MILEAWRPLSIALRRETFLHQKISDHARRFLDPGKPATLGTKWTLLILRDIGFLKIDRFRQVWRNIPGLTPRVLARQLPQMGQEGEVKREIRGKRSPTI